MWDARKECALRSRVRNKGSLNYDTARAFLFIVGTLYAYTHLHIETSKHWRSDRCALLPEHAIAQTPSRVLSTFTQRLTGKSIFSKYRGHVRCNVAEASVWRRRNSLNFIMSLIHATTNTFRTVSSASFVYSSRNRFKAQIAGIAPYWSEQVCENGPPNATNKGLQRCQHIVQHYYSNLICHSIIRQAARINFVTQHNIR